MQFQEAHVSLVPQAAPRVQQTPAEDGASPFVLYGMPISYLIDREGRPVGYITGEVDWTSGEGLAFLRYYIAHGR
jgi:hypothetical protein